MFWAIVVMVDSFFLGMDVRSQSEMYRLDIEQLFVIFITSAISRTGSDAITNNLGLSSANSILSGLSQDLIGILRLEMALPVNTPLLLNLLLLSTVSNKTPLAAIALFLSCKVIIHSY